MSKEMREQIDRVKNWKQFLNESIIDWYEKNKGVSDKVTTPTDGIIYHFTNNIEKLLNDDTLRIGDWGYVSFTRNPNLNYGKYRIYFDFNKLSLDYDLKDYIYDAGWDRELENDDLEKAINNIKKEEEIVAFKPIQNLNKYIIKYETI